MIEITNENVWYKKKKHRFSFKRFFCLILVLVIFSGLFCYYKQIVCKQIANICYEFTYSYSLESVNKSILNSLSNQTSYNQLITIEKNQLGDIVMISANSYKINYLNKEIKNKTKENLDEKLKNGIPIPLLSFTGLNILSGYGKPVSLRIVSVSSINSSFRSEFKSMGINQTLHSIYVEVQTSVAIEMPLNKEKATCVTEILICENVIIGKVPEIVLNGKLFN